MGILSRIWDQINGRIQALLIFLRKKIFGANNERIDFLMDSFYKLSPSHRGGVLVGGIGGVALFVLIVVVFYITRVNALQSDLDDSFTALHELQSLKAEYQREDRRFARLVETLKHKTNGIKLKPLFEKIAKDLSTQVEGLSEQKVNISGENALARKVQEMKVELRFPNISLPRLLNYLVEVEKSNSFLRIQDLIVRGRYGTRLFFDAQASVRGYVVGEEFK